MQHVLITGATGNIGSKLIDLLANNVRINLIPCYRSGTARQEFKERGLQPRYLDMSDQASVQASMLGIDRLFLLKPYSIQMLIQAKVLIDAAKKAGVKHIVHLGAHGVDDTSWAIIGWHQMVERYIEARGFDWTHLRPNFFMDNLFRGANSATGELYHYLGNTPVSWISTLDIAKAAAQALLNPVPHRNKTYSLASDRASLAEVAEMLSSVSEKTYRFVCLPRETGMETMLKMGREKEFINPWLDYMDAIKSDLVPEIGQTFEPITGVDQPLSLQQFIGQHAEHF